MAAVGRKPYLFRLQSSRIFVPDLDHQNQIVAEALEVSKTVTSLEAQVPAALGAHRLAQTGDLRAVW